MAVAPINSIINYAKISQYLSANDISRNKMLRGGDLMPRLSRLIYIVRKQVEGRYSVSPSDPTLDATANYLYALCGKYINQAKLIIGAGGTGTIINPSNNVISTIISRNVEFRVGEVGAPMIEGESSIVLVYPFVLNASAVVTLDGTDLAIAASDRISFIPTYGLATLTITFNQAVQNNQLYSIRFLQYLSI